MNIENLINEMSIEEKVSLLAGKNMWSLKGVERLKINEINVTDGPHGVRWSPESDFNSTRPATSLPIEAAMACTFNDELMYKVGGMVANECHHYGVGVLLGPGANGKRSPLGGRNFEYYSEDPFLSGKMATSFIKGVQDNGIGTSLKHFVLNDQETRRKTVEVFVDERAFREIYLYPFEMAIKEGKPWTIMGAYNKYRGYNACENEYLLKDILRDEFKYDGLVMTDWTAIKNKTLAHKSGLDLEMPGPGLGDSILLEALKNGDITEEIINKRVKKVLELIEKVEKNKKDVIVDFNKNHELALKMANESIVLLKNEDEILPLKKEKVAVIGEFAITPRFQGGGSSFMNPHTLNIPLEEMQKLGNVTFAKGYEKEYTNNELTREAIEIAKSNDKVVFFTGTTTSMESEGFDRINIKLPNDHIKLIKEVYNVNKNIIIVLNCGSAVDTIDIENYSKAIVQGWLLGSAGGRAIANILYGEINPSGKLSETFPTCIESNPTYETFPGIKDKVYYNESLMVGYRYYDTKKIPVSYCFGHGLSYTKFKYSNLRLSSYTIKNGDTLKVLVDVTNIGDICGKEVVQVYMNDEKSFYFRPYKELKGYKKVELKPNETKTVEIVLNERAFSYFVPNLSKFAVESGEFNIMVGNSVNNILLTEKLNFNSNDEVKIKLTFDDPIIEWLEDEDSKEVAKNLLTKLKFDESNVLYPIIIGISINEIFKMLEMFGMEQTVVSKIEKDFKNQFK